MADLNGNFVENVVGIVVVVIVVCLVAYPIISGIQFGEGDTTLSTIVNTIPLFLVISVLMAVAKMLYDRRN